MRSVPETFYTDPECLIVLFDLREAGAPESLHRQRSAWQAYSDIEALDADHVALIVRPGWVSEAA